MDWHIGLPQENASEVSVRFTVVSANKTKVELRHSRWEAFGKKPSQCAQVMIRDGSEFLKLPITTHATDKPGPETHRAGASR
jgi:hypothetical protein